MWSFKNGSKTMQLTKKLLTSDIELPSNLKVPKLKDLIVIKKQSKLITTLTS